MTTLSALIEQPWVQSLAWTLLHFVWQGALLGLAALLAFRFLTAGPGARYAAGVLVLAAMLLAPVTTFVVLSARAPEEAVPVASPGSRIETALQAEATPQPTPAVLPQEETSAPPAASAVPVATAAVAPIVVGVWLLGVSLLSFRLLGGWLVARRATRRSVEPVSAELQAIARRVAGRLALDRVVTVARSSAVAVPVLVGWIRPVVLLPAAALAGLTPTQVEALIAHELAHVRRHDYLVNLLQSVVETLLFYHPAVWWVSREVRRQREHCCDDLAVGVCDRLEYVQALANLAAMTTAVPRTAVAATGGSLLDRVRRLLGQQDAERPPLGWLAAFVVVLVIGASVPAALSMPGDSASSDEAQAVAGVRSGVSDGVTGGVSGGVRGGVSGGVSGGVARSESEVRTVEAVPQDPPDEVVARPREIIRPIQETQGERQADEARRAQLEAERKWRAVQQEIELRRLELELRQAQIEAQMQMELAQAEVRALEKQVDRSRRMVEVGVASPEMLAQLEIQMKRAQYALTSAQQQLAVKEEEHALRRQQLMQRLEYERQMRALGPEAERALESRAIQRQLEDAARRLEEARPQRPSASADELRDLIRELEARLDARYALPERGEAGAAERRMLQSRVIADPDAQVQAGDVLTVEIAGEPALPRAYLVDEAGSIRLPFLGAVPVVGQTTAQVADRISRRLMEKGLLEKASVTVTLRRR